MNCLLHRFWIDRALDDGRPLSARIERHLAGCPDCRRHHAQQTRLLRQLAGGGEGIRAEPSPFLRTRILGAVKAAARPANPSMPRWAWAAGCAGLLALAAIIFSSGSAPESGPVAQTEAFVPVTPPADTGLLETPARWTDGGRWLQVTTNLDQPLQRELNLVLEDARKALRALSADFLPGELLAQNQ